LNLIYYLFSINNNELKTRRIKAGKKVESSGRAVGRERVSLICADFSS